MLFSSARPVGTDQTAATSLTRELMRLAVSFWWSRDWLLAWAGLSALIGISFFGVYIDVWLNHWNSHFMEALKDRQSAQFMPLVVAAVIMTVAGCANALVSQFLYSLLGLRWRLAITRSLLDRYVSRDRFHEIERLQIIDNPDQRISEDVKAVPDYMIQLVVGALSACASAISFGYILLSTAPVFEWLVFGHTVIIPGGLLTLSLVYSTVGTVAVIHAGRPLVNRMVALQRHEANFRAGMLSLRKFAEQIALGRAQFMERRGLGMRFDSVYHTSIRVIVAQIGLSASQNIYGRIQTLLPLFMTVPRYFAGKTSFGAVVASGDAFSRMAGSLSFLTQAYQSVATVAAALRRLRDLDDAIDTERPRGITIAASPDACLRTEHLSLDLRGSRRLVDALDWVVAPGERWMVRGPSGCGKSTLVRAIGGLWPDGSGQVLLPAGKRLMVVPQRLYLPERRLADVVCFPDEAADHDAAAIALALQQAGLDTLVSATERTRPWQDELSPGEQQRLALARILLQRPDILLLDEPTSALDPANAQRFFSTLLAALPDLTLIHVSHSPALEPFHTDILSLSDGRAEMSRTGEHPTLVSN